MSTKYARGGFIPGDVSLRVRRLGVCANGHYLYQFGLDSPPEHAISAAEIKAGDRSKFECTETTAVQA